MKTVVHIGMPKAGSTALQTCLRASSGRLAEHGLLYPANPPDCRFNNHRLLAAQILAFDALPRHMKGPTGFSAATIDAGFDAFVAHVADQVAAQRPKGLILSAETLFRPLAADRHEAIRATYGRLGAAAPRFVAYLRKPSDRYLGGLLQTLNASTQVQPPRPVAYRAVLESYEACFGAGTVSVRLYDRAHLENGDVVADFFASCLPEFGIDPAGLSAEGKRNETLSGESMDIVARHRAAFHPDANDVHTRDTTQLRAALAAIERGHGAAKPRLHPDVAEAVDYASADCLWVRERYGVVFSGLDYDRLAAGARAAPPRGRARRLEELIVIDRAMQARLLEDLAGSPWAAGDASRGAWIDALRAPGGLEAAAEPRRDAAPGAGRRARRRRRAGG